jgi:deoxyribodipyrimidine photo-lyase
MIVHIFRRDLNINDNYALNLLLEKYSYKDIKYIFIFNREQIEDNKLFNDYQFNFMCSQLSYLSTLIDLKFYYVNKVEEEIYIIKKLKISTLSFNKDYTPYAKKRDQLLINFCLENNIELITSEFYYWTNPYNKIYYKFSSFYEHYDKRKINIVFCNIKKYNPSNILAYKIKAIDHRTDAQKIMSNKFNDYVNKRNSFIYKTTEIGIYIKFCVVTSREVYNNYFNNKALDRELIFRDFFYTLDYIHPEYFSTKKTIKIIKWNNNKNNIKKFIEGNTGENIIDASINQLKKYNYMHNRSRMLCVNYLVKHLEENWQHGELLFAKYLKDYDPIINFQNWVYMSGLHIYSFQYYRIFNYERQIKLYNGKEYIKLHLEKESKDKIKYDQKALNYIKKVKYIKSNINV